MKLIAKIFILTSLILTACSTQKQIKPTPITISTVLPTETIASQNNCTLEIAMQNAIDFFESYSEFSVSHSKLDEHSTLTVWLVIPEINPDSADKEVIEENALGAMGASLAPQISLVTSEECIATQFSYIEMIIVDREYHGWVSQKVDIQDIPSSADADNPSFDDIDALFQKANISYWRNEPTEKLLSNKEPTWDSIRKKIIDALPNKTENSSFIIVVDGTGIDITAQWQEPDGTEEYKEVDMQLTVKKIIEVLNLMPEKPDSLKFSVVDKEGNFQIVGVIPQLDLNQAKIGKAPFNVSFDSP